MLLRGCAGHGGLGIGSLKSNWTRQQLLRFYLTVIWHFLTNMLLRHWSSKNGYNETGM
ncbi:hypothetical protein LINPERHAP1_LOCUS29541 [Linum perenne]